MIYGTGDTHIPIHIHKLNVKNFPEQREMTKADFLIVMGDFGLIWDNVMSETDRWWMNWLNDRNFTTLFVSGNHENHWKLSSGKLASEVINTEYYSIEEKFGGYVGKISDSIYHLRNGEGYIIQGKKFFVMGGASSVDKLHRIEGKSWWPEEIPNYKEYEYGLTNLERYKNEIDYILVHTAPASIIEEHLYNNDCGEFDSVSKFLDRVIEIVQFKALYFGHFHIDAIFEDKYYALFNRIVRIV